MIFDGGICLMDLYNNTGSHGNMSTLSHDERFLIGLFWATGQPTSTQIELND